jgi:hypothetical protein
VLDVGIEGIRDRVDKGEGKMEKGKRGKGKGEREKGKDESGEGGGDERFRIKMRGNGSLVTFCIR